MSILQSEDSRVVDDVKLCSGSRTVLRLTCAFDGDSNGLNEPIESVLGDKPSLVTLVEETANDGGT